MIIHQRILLRLLARCASGSAGNRFLGRRVWTIEGGEGKGLKLRFPQNLEYISGASEIPVQRELAHRLRPGGVFYDVGANMGFFSIIAGRLVGEKGTVCAFEPLPQNAAAIRENSKLNGLGNLRLFEVAAGRNSRRADFITSKWDGGGSLVGPVTTPGTRIDRTEVQVVALDEFITSHRLPNPTFVKIDVEGAELEVIEGMVDTLIRCKPVLLYEIDDGNRLAFERRWGELDERVRELDYEVVHLEDSYPTMNWNVGHSVALPLTGR